MHTNHCRRRVQRRGNLAFDGSPLPGSQVDARSIDVDAKLVSTVVWTITVCEAFDSKLYSLMMRYLVRWGPDSFDKPEMRNVLQVSEGGGEGTISVTNSDLVCLDDLECRLRFAAVSLRLCVAT